MTDYILCREFKSEIEVNVHDRAPPRPNQPISPFVPSFLQNHPFDPPSNFHGKLDLYLTIHLQKIRTIWRAVFEEIEWVLIFLYV